MKKIVMIFLVLMYILFFNILNSQELLKNSAVSLPFKRGVNFTQWLEYYTKETVNINYYVKDDFINAKKLGCDVIRLPVYFNKFLDKDMNIETILLEILDNVVDWANELQIYLIIDNHSFDPFVPIKPREEKRLIKIWDQISKRYATKSNYVVYEILNEPYNIDNKVWAKIQQNVVNKIRENDLNKYIIVTASQWSNIDLIQDLPDYGDRIIYTFHFYEPIIFTHQKASWVSPSLEDFGGLYFPYNDKNIDLINWGIKKYKNSWLENSLRNYKEDGTVENVLKMLDKTSEIKKGMKRDLYCGEFGVFNKEAPEESRRFWYKVVREKLEDLQIPWTIWDYKGEFGIFKKGSIGIFPNDLDYEILKNLGFNYQNLGEEKILELPKTFYNEGFDNFFNVENWISKGLIDYYYKDAKEGRYALMMKNLDKYNRLRLFFKKKLNLEKYLDKNISFYLKVSNINTRFDIIFNDSVEYEGDKPWRIGYTVNCKEWCKEKDKWYKVSIPLKDFKNKGSYYKDMWFEPVGDGDWKNIESFDIVNEFGDLNKNYILIDNIFIE